MIKHYDVVIKLTGPIDPVGETNEDNRRLDNLKVLTELVDRLLFDIGGVASKRVSPEYSVRRAGDFAFKFLDEIRESLLDT